MAGWVCSLDCLPLTPQSSNLDRPVSDRRGCGADRVGRDRRVVFRRRIGPPGSPPIDRWGCRPAPFDDPSGLLRGTGKQAGPYRSGVLGTSLEFFRRPRDRHRTSAQRQRVLLSLKSIAAALGSTTHTFTRAYRPQTYGKAERSTAPSWPNGATPEHGPQRLSGPPDLLGGCTPTTIIVITLQSEDHL
jgi:hypothetical protein